MAAGDDVTDEDLFARLPESAWTIHVGRNQSRARFYVPNPDEMIALLAKLLEVHHKTAIPKLELLTGSNQARAAEIVNG
jgi:trehalose-6-phosphatase